MMKSVMKISELILTTVLVSVTACGSGAGTMQRVINNVPAKSSVSLVASTADSFRSASSLKAPRSGLLLENSSSVSGNDASMTGSTVLSGAFGGLKDSSAASTSTSSFGAVSNGSKVTVPTYNSGSVGCNPNPTAPTTGPSKTSGGSTGTSPANNTGKGSGDTGTTTTTPSKNSGSTGGSTTTPTKDPGKSDGGTDINVPVISGNDTHKAEAAYDMDEIRNELIAYGESKGLHYNSSLRVEGSGYPSPTEVLQDRLDEADFIQGEKSMIDYIIGTGYEGADFNPYFVRKSSKVNDFRVYELYA